MSIARTDFPLQAAPASPPARRKRRPFRGGASEGSRAHRRASSPNPHGALYETVETLVDVDAFRVAQGLSRAIEANPRAREAVEEIRYTLRGATPRVFVLLRDVRWEVLRLLAEIEGEAQDPDGVWVDVRPVLLGTGAEPAARVHPRVPWAPV